MFTRRAFSLGLASAAIAQAAGCDRKPPPNPELSRQAIDIHTHIFNGLDIPAVGFLRQVVMREPHTPPDADMLTDSFLLLLKAILLSGTPSAADELESLGRRDRPAGEQERAARDQENVASGIARFQRDSQRSLSLTARSEANRILDRLAAELASPGIRTTGLQTPEDQARILAARLYGLGQPGALTTGGPRGFTFQSSFLQTIRWAGMLTRPRYDLVATLDGLYGGAGHIRVFTPSLVDLGAWLLTPEDATPLDRQIEVTSAIARKYSGALILPFVAFCPLRAVLDRGRGKIPLRDVEHAILNRGFVGVKLYPPMGFRPTGNRADIGSWLPRRPPNLDEAIDRELTKLYDWCVVNDVPITAHANKSMGAGPGSSESADPDYWRPVLDAPRFARLRLNLAHYGGFDETASPRALGSAGDWEETLADMVGSYRGVYFDLGYWTEAGDPGSPERARVLELTRRLVARSPVALDRMMYGSDWSMIGREPSHPGYLSGVDDALKSGLSLTADQVDRVMGQNALAFLGLDRPGLQRDRVAAFHGGHPLYREIFEAKAI